jgi:hypothetical protein
LGRILKETRHHLESMQQIMSLKLVKVGKPVNVGTLSELGCQPGIKLNLRAEGLVQISRL